MADEPLKPDPQPLREIRGETLEDLSNPVSHGVMTNHAEYEAAWKSLGLKESPGPVDFAQEILFLATTRGSRINLRTKDEGERKLRVMAMATRDIRPGLRFVFGVFGKADWKQINETVVP